jgi:Domain of unknown function (DUF4440)
MKKHLPLAALLMFAFVVISAAQTPAASPSPSPKPKPRMTKAQLLKKLSANETRLWEGWKNKDTKPFQMWLAPNGVMIGDQGVGTKAEVVKMMASMPCEVKSYALSDWSVAMIDADAAVLTYKGAADGTCGGQAVPTVWASSVWVNRRGRWLAFSHQETPVK